MRLSALLSELREPDAAASLGEDVAQRAGDLVELGLRGDERRRDLDDRVAAVVGAAENVSRVSLSFTSSSA